MPDNKIKISKKVEKALDKDHWSASPIFDWLYDNGFTVLGEGNFTTTFGKPSVPYVVKVNTRDYIPALKYYTWVSRQRCKYLPKVYRVRPYVTHTGGVLFVAIVERLHDFDHITPKQLNRDGIGFLSWLAYNEDIIQSGFPQQFVDEFTSFNEAVKWQDRNHRTIGLIEYFVENTFLFSSTDVHERNIMVRLPKGDVVLTDPVA